VQGVHPTRSAMYQRAFVFALLTSSLTTVACRREESRSVAPQAGASAADISAQRIAVTSDGFVPSGSRVKVGQPVTLVVTRQVERTCATDIVIKDYGVNTPLPQGQPVEVTFTPTKAGPLRYGCAMDMLAGALIAE